MSLRFYPRERHLGHPLGYAHRFATSAQCSARYDTLSEGNLEWMTQRRVLGFALPLTLLALSSVSIDRGRTLRFVDIDGMPIEGVFVIYHHEGHRLNPAHATTYEASRRSRAQSRSVGRVDISPSVHVHWPFPIETHPGVRVDLVYAPAFHNGLATIGDRAIAQAGAFDVAGDQASGSSIYRTAPPFGKGLFGI